MQTLAMSEATTEEDIPPFAVPKFIGKKTPGVNVDPIDREAGIAMLVRMGYDDPRTIQVIDYCLWRWGHGEEDQAERNAIDKSFYGIDYTTWRAVLAAAIASGTEKL